ncbi:hypothetical protein NE865_12813 [Phthorimaea operculella]|nr:hypothetical protein NE865_13982 [Phthorimaea operculella]KAI5634480.1 hypothetical protein NE865_12813 [Phthorimaea operculella]
MAKIENLEDLFLLLKVEMANQTTEITNNLMDALAERITPLEQENKILKNKVEILETKLSNLEIENKKNNVILYGMEEKDEENAQQLLESTITLLSSELNVNIERTCVNKIYRIGKRQTDPQKPRPVLLSLTNTWRKAEILKNKRNSKQLEWLKTYRNKY